MFSEKINILVWCLFLLLYSCKEEKPNFDEYYNTKISELETKLAEERNFVTMLNDEMSVVNSTLDSLYEVYGIPITDSDTLMMVDRLGAMQVFISQSQKKINTLEEKVYSLENSNQVALLNKIIVKLKKDVFEKQVLVEKYKIRNDSLKREVALLNKKVMTIEDVNDSLTIENEDMFKKQSEFNAKLTSIENEIAYKTVEYNALLDQMNVERTAFVMQKEKMSVELDSARAQVEIEKGKAYFEMGTDLLKQYDDTKNGILGGKKKIKKELLLKAYEYLRKSCFSGNTDAALAIRVLLTKSEYYKNLNIDRNSTQISHCGI
ncbi:MAG TPA: hypothetical protein VK169_08755 [Saprospiraceae bacterium]|nr:hypothetical protein [Saprospiraceae bacterium]